jgi:hypothetical protein
LIENLPAEEAVLFSRIDQRIRILGLLMQLLRQLLE